MSEQKFSPKTMRQLLGDWDHVAKLGQHPLSQTAVVQDKLRDGNHPATAVGHGLALKELLV